MKTVAANLVIATDTFNTAFTDINLLIDFCKTDAISANSTQGSTTGNAALVGTFTSSNISVTGSLRGGTLSTPASLNVSTNVVFLGGLVNSTANLSVTALSTLVGNTTISGNSTVVVITVTGNTTVSEMTLGGTNLKVNSNLVANGSASFNNTHTVIGNTSISGNSTVVGVAVTTNSTVTNTYLGGSNVTVNAITTMTKNVFMSGDLTVSGALNATLGASTGNFNPAANATYSLGNSTFTWLASLDSPIIYTKITPSANDVLLGNTTNRFAAAFSTANASGIVTLGANLVIGTTGFIVDAGNKKASINVAIGTDALLVAGTVNATALNITTTASVTGNATIGGLVMGNTVMFSNTTSVAGLSQTVVDSFPKATSPMAKWVVMIKDTTTLVHALEILATHEGTNVLLTKYGEIFNTSLGTFDVSINGANVEFLYTSSNAGTGPWSVKTSRIQTI